MKFIIAITIFVIGILLIVLLLKPATPEIKPKIGKHNEIINNTNKSEVTKEKKAIEETPKTNTTNNDTPIIDGKKIRPSAITEKDELYQEEFAEKPELIEINEPALIRPKEPFIQWVLQCGASVAGAVLHSNNKIFFATYDYQAFIANAESGELLLKCRTVSQPVSTPLLFKDLFVVPQRNGQITAFKQSDGKEIWNHRSVVDKPDIKIDLSISCIALLGDKIGISKHWGNLYSINGDNGIMAQDMGVTYESRINLPAIKTDSGVLFSNVAGEIHAFKNDGDEDFSYNLEKGYPLGMQISNGVLFIITTEKQLIALQLKNKQILWSIELTGVGFDSICINKNTLYLQAKDFYAIDINNGKIIYQTPSKSEMGFCRGTPVIINDSIYAIEQNGRLIKCNLTTGQFEKEYLFNEIVRSPISATANLLVIPTLKKKIYAINLSKW